MSFADDERRATLACFSTSGIAFAARYRPAIGVPVNTTVIIEDEQVATGDEPGRNIGTATILRMLTSVVHCAQRGDIVEVTDTGQRFAIEHEMRRDALQVHYVVASR